MQQNEFDVAVVGSGGAGLSAAITAREHGASVIIVEADKKLGGATRNSTGVVYAAGTSTQREAGIDDDADSLFDYLMILNQHSVRPAMMRFYADQSAGALEWLKAQGVEFPTSMLLESCISGVRRGHTPASFGLGLVETLINTAGAVGAETAVGTRVDELVLEDNKVCGLRAEGFELRVGAVVIATGGFGNNPEMIRRLFPSAAHHGNKTWAIHRDAPFILGDGIKLGEAVGAAITGYDHGLILPSACFDSRHMEAFLPPWVVAVNLEGKRFMAEWDSYCVVGNLINEQTDRRCWAIFDHKALVENDDDTRYSDPYKGGHVISSWERNSILSEVGKGVVKTSDTIEGLAQRIGIDKITLGETIRIYNADVDNGEDRQFYKSGNGRPLPAVRYGPFYAVEVRPAIIGFTAAGLDVNVDCRVLDKHGRAIPGLYAAGEVLGSYHGKRYGGGGMSVGGGVVFGRRAGEEAASYACGSVVAQ